jgi:LacI family transcriptional regulator
VVGFDDFQIATQVWPTLTTVHSPIRSVGLLAAQRLFAGIDEGKAPVAESETLLPRLVVRESTGPAPL